MRTKEKRRAWCVQVSKEILGWVQEKTYPSKWLVTSPASFPTDCACEKPTGTAGKWQSSDHGLLKTGCVNRSQSNDCRGAETAVT